jgi:hypothetical protein
MLATVNSHLADSLFRQNRPARQQPQPIRDIQQAVQNARGRWPDLAGMVDAAVVLVEGDSLYELAGEPTMLALCRPEAAGPGHLVSQTTSGLGCTCDVWPPAKKAGPGDGLYCPDILATLLQIYLNRPLRQAEQSSAAQGRLPLPYSPEALWQKALQELQYQMTKATFTNWLAGSRAIPEASSARLLTVEVRNRCAQEWLTHRLQPVINRAVAGIAGYGLVVCLVVTPMRSDPLRTTETSS